MRKCLAREKMQEHKRSSHLEPLSPSRLRDLMRAGCSLGFLINCSWPHSSGTSRLKPSWAGGRLWIALDATA